MKTKTPLIISFLALYLCLGTVTAQLFEVDSDIEQPTISADVLMLVTNDEALYTLKKHKQKSISLALPFFNETELVLDLEMIEIHAPGFQVISRSEDGNKVMPYNLGTYYRGKVAGYENSSAVFTIHNKEVSALINYKGQVYNMGKVLEEDYHILYRAEDKDQDLGLKCATSTEDYYKPSKQTFKRRKTACSTVVDIYFECDYQMYQNFNSSTTAVTNYVNTLFAQINTIYSNESIDIQISEIVVWTSNDGYSSGVSGLNDFANANSAGFNGDVAHLLTNDNGSNGGVAYVNQLCGSSPFGYSDINNASSNFPSYSWDVQVVTHELGHNFGSSHTHDCTWGPNNDQQIDDCGNIALGGGSCYNPSSPIVPSGGGTIMSYCHLNGVGINFNNGFGQEPGDLIRAAHSSCMCDNSTCEDATVLNSSGTYNAQPSAGNGASQPNATHADWYQFTPTTNGKLDAYSCGSGVDTRLWLYHGNCNNLIFEASSDDDCASFSTFNYASEIVNHDVIAGVTYYIEWDNRWSTASFDWQFTFTPDSNSSSVNISCPTNYTGLNSCSSSDYDPNVTGYASSSTAGTTISYADNISSALCTVDVIREWTATDGNGDTAACTQLISLQDSNAPSVGYCPQNIIVTSDSSCTATVTWTSPNAFDDCTSVTTNSNYNSGDNFPLGVTSINYTFQDECSNIAFCNFSVTVLDGCTSALSNCDGQHIIMNNAISTDEYNAEQTMQLGGTVMPNAQPVFKAGTEIMFTAGFEVPLGSTIEATIENCNN